MAVADQMATTVAEQYTITACRSRELSSGSLIRCLELIEQGEATDLKSAAVNLIRSIAVVVARADNVIVGVGVLKHYRPEYAEEIGLKCGTFPPRDAPEVGYVAVALPYRYHGIAHRIVSALCAGQGGPLFATTSSSTLQKALDKLGFTKVGREWDGKRGDRISLWIRKDVGVE